MDISFRSSDRGDVISWDHVTAMAFEQSPPAARTRSGGEVSQNKAAREKPDSWEALLATMIKTEILPRLISARTRGPENAAKHAETVAQPGLDVPGFVDLIIADDIEQIRAVADQVIVQCGGRDALLHRLLTPAARLLGEMWDQDTCDLMTVTLGVYRLDQIMRETATPDLDEVLLNGHEHRILLLPAPGEQHSFGVAMVADAFREHGWCVRSGPAVTRSKLLRLVRNEWFDVVGLSVSSDRAMKGLASYLRAIRTASCNARVYLMLGGDAIQRNSESVRFLGANATAADAIEAVAKVELLFQSSMTVQLNQSIER